MHRLVAILLGSILASTAGQPSILHVHAYADHDHPEHRHGPAAHDHHQRATHPEDEGIRLEACEPGHDASSVTMGCTPGSHAKVIYAEVATPTSIGPLVEPHSVHGLIDIRVHGPPARTQASPRGPPQHPA